VLKSRGLLEIALALLTGTLLYVKLTWPMTVSHVASFNIV
jgi:hypothetical protein